MREFSDSIKFLIVKENLQKNDGRICCEICGKELKSITEGHFDHIHPYAKGGKSIKSNCQILCSDCNLKKNDKELADFILDEKARKFLEGSSINEENTSNHKERIDSKIANKDLKEITKEEFDIIISEFIERKGKINKIDFNRVYNNLPPIKYVYKYYGDFFTLRQAFNLKEKIIWDRKTIKKSLEEYIKIHGDILQKDLKTDNELPSYPCILKYYPEYKGLNELKKDMFGLKTRDEWTKDKVLECGKKFIKHNGKITLKDLKAENNLPTAKVIYKYFGTMCEYQRLIGANISQKNELITIGDIDEIVEELFKDRSRKFNTRKDFLNIFPISESSIYKNFSTFDSFCEKYKIKIAKKKKAKYSKQEIDNLILNYIKEGNTIPKSAKDLVKLGLPSRDAIVRYYEDWHEPFVLYSKLYDKLN